MGFSLYSNSHSIDTPYSITVCENSTQAGLAFFQVRSQDIDSPPDNNQVQYRINETLFAINSDGVLSFTSLLDYEDMPMHDITVHATDNGTPQLSSSTVVALYVCDSNDNDPLISRPDGQLVEIPEDIPIYSIVADVVVQDEDSGTNADFTLSFTNVFPAGCVVSFLTETLRLSL